MFRVAIITSSDSGYEGKREDLSGPTIEKIVTEYGYKVVHKVILPDERDMLSNEMKKIADEDIAGVLIQFRGGHLLAGVAALGGCQTFFVCFYIEMRHKITLRSKWNVSVSDNFLSVLYTVFPEK